MNNRPRRHLIPLLLFFGLTGLLTNPLFLHLWDAVEDKQDALLNTWIIAWVGHALSTDPLNLYHANIFYPYPNALAFSEINIPQGLLAFPLTQATGNPILSYNLVVVAALLLDAFGMYLLAFDLTRRRGPALVAGLIYAFNPYNLGNLAQEQLLWLGFMPLALMFLRRLLVQPPRPSARRDAFLLALFFSLQTLGSIYSGMFVAIAAAVYVVGWAVVTARGQTATRRHSPGLTREGGTLRRIGSAFAPLLLSALLIALFLVPFLLPYFQVQRTLGFERSLAEAEPFSAYLKQFLEVAPQSLLYGGWLAPRPPVYLGGYPLDTLFPGLIPLALALVGLFARGRARDRGLLALLAAVAFILSLGPRLYLSPQQPTGLVLPYRWLYDLLPFLRALRAPVRFDALLMFALALLAALGAARLLERVERTRQANTWRQPASNRPQRITLVLVILAFALISLEYLNLPAANVAPVPVGDAVPPVYRWLATQRPSVILEVPMLGPDAAGALDLTPQYLSTYHWDATPDGYSGFVPPRRGEIAYEMEEVGPRSAALLGALDVRYFIVHTDRFTGTVSSPALSRVQQFPNAEVYRVALGAAPQVTVRAYLPNPVPRGEPFFAFLIVTNRGAAPFAVKPTDSLALAAHWSSGAVEEVAAPLPLVTSRVSVVPVLLHAPAASGPARVELRAANGLLGGWAAAAETRVAESGSREIVIPARVKLGSVARRGPGLSVELIWQVENKIDAYYSVSLRLVDGAGAKVASADRQPDPPTLLWRPGRTYTDRFDLNLPQDLTPGTYHLELLMYQANDDTSVLLLNAEDVPVETVELGEVKQ